MTAQIEQRRAVLDPITVPAVERPAGSRQHHPTQRQQRAGELGRPRPRYTPGARQRRPQARPQQSDRRQAEPPFEPPRQPDAHRQHQVEDGEPMQQRKPVAHRSSCGAILPDDPGGWNPAVGSAAATLCAPSHVLLLMPSGGGSDPVGPDRAAARIRTSRGTASRWSSGGRNTLRFHPSAHSPMARMGPREHFPPAAGTDAGASWR